MKNLSFCGLVQAVRLVLCLVVMGLSLGTAVAMIGVVSGFLMTGWTVTVCLGPAVMAAMVGFEPILETMYRQD